MRPARRSVSYVVDASVVAGAFFQDEHADACRSLLGSKHRLHAPDLIYPETATPRGNRRPGSRGIAHRHPAPAASHHRFGLAR